MALRKISGETNRFDLERRARSPSYLGQVIEREVSGGPLLIGLPPSYYDSIVEAAQLDVVKPPVEPTEACQVSRRRRR